MFHHVLVLKLDRLSRRQKDTLYLIEDVFLEANVGFHSVTESFDTTTPYGKAALGMMAVFAQLERETIVERVKMAKKETSRLGKWKGGDPPFGYRYNFERKQLAINSEEALHVKEIFSLYVTGNYGFQTIADILNDKKIRTRKDVLWLKSTIRQILTNPTYIGKIRHYEATYDGPHEAIISDDVFEITQKMINNRYIARPLKDKDNLLGGLLYCSECGARLRFKSKKLNTHINKYYVCYTRYGSPDMAKADHCDSPYFPAHIINEQVISRLSELTLNNKKVDSTIKALVHNTSDNSQEFERLISDKKSIIKRLDRWYNVFENGTLESAQPIDRITALREKQLDVENKIKIIKQAIAREQKTVISAEEIKIALQSFMKNWEYATVNERRTIIVSLVKKIIVHSDKNIDIEFRI